MAVDKKTLGLLALGGVAAYLFSKNTSNSAGTPLGVTNAPTPEEMARRWATGVGYQMPGGNYVGNPTDMPWTPGYPIGGGLANRQAEGQRAARSILDPINSKIGTLNVKPAMMALDQIQATGRGVIDQRVLAASMERFRKEMLKENPRWLPDLGDKFEMQTSELVAYIQNGEPAIFYMPFKLDEALRMPRVLSGRMTFYIDSWESFRYLSNLILFAMFQVTYGKHKEVAGLVKFFNYHEFYMDTEGDVYKDMMRTLSKWLCSCDDRIQSMWWDIDCYPGMFQGLGDKCDPYNAMMKEKVNAVFNDGLMMMVEYASAKYSSITFASMFNPALGQMFADSMGKLISSAVTLAVSATAVMTGMIATTAIPVVGWITGALAAAAAAIMALFNVWGMLEKNHNMRQTVSTRINVMLKTMFRRGTMEEEFSGYLLDILLPNKSPWDDIRTERDGNAWHEFCIVHSKGVWAAPQIPWVYLNYDADFICSMTVPGQEFLILRPVIEFGVMKDWTQVVLGTNDDRVNLFGDYKAP